MFSVPNEFRLRYHPLLGTDDSAGNNGAFKVMSGKTTILWVVAAEGMGWEHVSVHTQTPNGKRTPTWEEMCHVKQLFWGDEDSVVQFHPPKSEYVNQHEHCLHLWRPIGTDIPTPPAILVGRK